jgi:sugar phosphate isomerase/epimerase
MTRVPRFSRRQFVKTSALLSFGLTAMTGAALAQAKEKRKFSICLDCGAIGLASDPRKEIEWVGQHGFEAIAPAAEFLGKLSDAALQDYLGQMQARKLGWGAAGLPVEFRGDESTFERGLQSLPAFARSLARARATRVATWLSPSSRSLTYVANFRQHARRLREVARVLGDHGVRLGLEYVGPKTAWTASRFPFIHTMAEMKDLIAEINRDNVGFLLDSWHWYTAHETEADLLSLKATDVVLCHLNDAPKDTPVDQQVDNRRELPCATGVIDVKAFLGAMIQLGYDGPVVCEPFRPELRSLPVDQALATVASAVKKAVALAES